MRLALVFALTSLLGAADRFPVPPAPADLASPPAPGAPTGLAWRTLAPGRGEGHPAADSLVTVEYTLWAPDGHVIDSTARLDHPLSKPMGRLLKGMRDGLQLMGTGEKRRFWMPEALTFGGAANRPAGTLVMDLELIRFEPSPFTAPADVAGPGPDAQVLASGLAFKVLRPGTGTEHPGKRSAVTVQYSGWTTDGRLFDSSWKNPTSATLRLDQVIKGWTLGIPRMVAGEKTRFWIPEKLAYKGEAGQPAGMLVFDIELIDWFD